MTDPIRELKARAKLRQHRLERAGTRVQRRECLSQIAVELGFTGWQHASAVLSGSPDVVDYGTMLYPRQCHGTLNLWYRNYEDAIVGRREARGYLLAYRRDFVVVDRMFIESLGLDPDAPEWTQIGFDWARPADIRARTHLYGLLIAQRPRESA